MNMKTIGTLKSITLSGHTYAGVLVVMSEYHAGGTAIVLCDDQNEQLATATVWLETPPAPGCVWIKNWSENVGMLEALTDAGIIKPTGRIRMTGFVSADEAELVA